MTLSEILRSRHSCRSFLPDELPEGLIAQLFDLAQLTPSWCNVQPWEIFLTNGEATRKFGKVLTQHAQTAPPAPDIEMPAGYDGIYGDRRRESGYALYQALGIERTDYEARRRQADKNFIFFGAPHTAVIATPVALGPYAAIDCGAYVSTLLMAAQELGIGAVAQAAIAVHSDAVRKHLEIPGHLHIVCAVSFGFEDKDDVANSFRTTRASLDEVVHAVG